MIQEVMLHLFASSLKWPYFAEVAIMMKRDHLFKEHDKGFLTGDIRRQISRAFIRNMQQALYTDMNGMPTYWPLKCTRDNNP